MASATTLLASLRSQTVVDCDTLDVTGELPNRKFERASRLTLLFFKLRLLWALSRTVLRIKYVLEYEDERVCQD